MHARIGLAALALLGVTACTTSGSPSLIPSNAGIKLTPTTTVSLERILTWGVYAGVIYIVIDPLSPNWEIEEAKLTPQLVHYDLKMKRFYDGGPGEAHMVLDRRARQLVLEGNFAGYKLIEYNEGIDSSVLGSQRRAEGVIRLIPRFDAMSAAS